MDNKLLTNLSKISSPLANPWGETIYGLIGKYGISYSDYHSMDLCKFGIGKRNGLHYHVDMEESYTIIKGKGLMRLGNTEFEVSIGDTVHIPPKTAHSILNIGDEDLEVMCACAPAWFEEATVRLEKWDEENQKWLKK
jgi:mannose-6-phosphate isomerase-like protein (cupin superfamily)